MRYRKLSATGDYVFGQSAKSFLVNTPEAVAQAIYTRLMLWKGEWFLDETEGTPYTDEIVGHVSNDSSDVAIRQRILDTPGVTEIVSYGSNVVNRRLTIVADVDTAYGSTTINFKF